MASPQPLPSRLIGALFVERGLVSESQIRVALELQDETGQQLGQILVERFGVSRRELASVVAEQWAKLGGSSGPEDNASWRRLGEIFVDRGFVTQEELDNALKRQRQTGERLGEALVAQGVISKFELAGALAEQMAALEEQAAREAEQPEQPEQAEATVHQFPSRDVEVSFGAMVENVEPDVGAPEGVVEELPSADVGEPEADSVESADAQHDEEAALMEVAAVMEEVSAAPEPEPEPEPEPVPQPEPELEPQPVEALGDPPAEPVTAPEGPVEEPEPTRYSYDYLPGPEADEAAANGARVGEPALTCLAFAPTTTGYRLVELVATPSAGERVDVPDVGERIVLRVGASPLPDDGRLCAYLEEPVTSVPA